MKNQGNFNSLEKWQSKDTNAKMMEIAAIIKMLQEVRASILKTDGNSLRKETQPIKKNQMEILGLKT